MRNTYLKVDLSAISHNLREVRLLIGEDVKVIGIVKSDGYGHGIVEVAKQLVSSGIDMLGVAFGFEGKALRQAGITLPIIITAGISDRELVEIVDYDLTPVIGNLNLLDHLVNIVPKDFNVHLNIDTGMTRLGLSFDEGLFAVNKISEKNNLVLSGLMTHFSESEDEYSGYTKDQIAEFKIFFEKINSPENIMLHAANSGAIINLKESHFDAVRPGLMLYGSLPDIRLAEKVNLHPVGSLLTEIVNIKKVNQGTPIGYGCSYIAKRDKRVAMLPLGYGDGYSRGLSNVSYVIIDNMKAPLLGRVSMDTIAVDVTDIAEAKNGDQVIVMGSDGINSIVVEELAIMAKTIPYEIFTGITSRVPRKYV